MLIKMYARNNTHLMHLINNYIQNIPGVARTETLLSLEQSIDRDIAVDATSV